jgi:hypothetical protein
MFVTPTAPPSFTPLPPSRCATDVMEVDGDMITRYLQYQCSYRMCKYKGEDIKTWGELIRDDRAHFVFLISSEVSVESNTFVALSTFLSPQELSTAVSYVRRRDTPEGKEDTCGDFLRLICSHKGRMNGKTWQAVRELDYSYFVWSVGNSMGRDTKTFNVFFDCLHPKEQTLVRSTAKGQVRVAKGLKY